MQVQRLLWRVNKNVQGDGAVGKCLLGYHTTLDGSITDVRNYQEIIIT